MYPVRIQGTSTNLRAPCGPATEAQERELGLALSLLELRLSVCLLSLCTRFDELRNRGELCAVLHGSRFEEDDTVRRQLRDLGGFERDPEIPWVDDKQLSLRRFQDMDELLRSVGGVRGAACTKSGRV